MLYEEVLELLQKDFSDIDFTSSETLVDDGILDSLTVIEIISELCMSFDVLFPQEEIRSDNFNSVCAMAALVEKYR
jgi:acyl carrier protein